MKQKLLMLLVSFFVVNSANVLGQTYKEFTDTTLFYTTIANCKADFENGWITDGKGVNTFNEVKDKSANIDPETDEEIKSTVYPGIGIKGANANKGAILYVTGVSSFGSYFINSSGSKDRAMIITYTDGITTDSKTTIVTSNISGYCLIEGLNPSDNYIITYTSYELKEGEVDLSSGGDMVLYAVRFFAEESSFVSAAISSVKVNDEQVTISGTKISANIPYDYVEENISLEIQVNVEAEVTIQGEKISNDNGKVTTIISTPEESLTLNIEVETVSETKEYTLEVIREEESFPVGTYKNFTETTLFYTTIANSQAQFKYGWITDGKGVATFNEVKDKSANIDPETDEEINSTVYPGIGIKGANANKGAILYVTGVSSFGSYFINSSGSKDRAMIITYTDGITTDSKTTIVTSNISGYCLIEGLNPSDNYIITYTSYELEEGEVDLSSGGDMVLYAVKFFAGNSTTGIINEDGTVEELTAESLAGRTQIKLTGELTAAHTSILNAASLTSINLESATSIKGVLIPLNPNCLVFASANLSLATTDAVSYNLIVDEVAENIILTDGADFNNPKAFTANSISYTRNYTTAGWASLCLPFALETIPAGVTVQEFADSEGTNVTFEKVPELEANTPYIAHIPNTGNIKYSATDVNVPESAEMARIIQGEYAFEGTFSRIADGEGYFLLNSNGNGFGMGASGSDIPAFRAYIDYIGSEPNNAQQLTLAQGGDGTTGLEVVEANGLAIYSANSGIEVVSDQALELVIYSVDGRIVNKVQITEGTTAIALSKGIYLVNNQKVAVK